MAINFFASQKLADSIIRDWGQASFLSRAGVTDRQCWCYIVDYKPFDRLGKFIDPQARRAMVSPFDRLTGLPLLAPDPDLDTLLTPSLTVSGKLDRLRIIAPVGKIAPGNVVVAWDLQVVALA